MSLLFQGDKGTGPAPVNDYEYLWRLIDTLGGVAPDTGVGGFSKDLDVTGMALEGDGLRVASANANLYAQTSSLSINLQDPSVPYTMLLKCTQTDWGYVSPFGFVFTTAVYPVDTGPFSVYYRESSDGLAAKLYDKTTQYISPAGFNIATPYDIVFWRDAGVTESVMLFANNTLFHRQDWGAGAGPCTVRSVDTYKLRFANRRDLDGAYAGIFHWIGFHDTALTEESIAQRLAGGRP